MYPIKNGTFANVALSIVSNDPPGTVLPEERWVTEVEPDSLKKVCGVWRVSHLTTFD